LLFVIPLIDQFCEKFRDIAKIIRKLRFIVGRTGKLRFQFKRFSISL